MAAPPGRKCVRCGQQLDAAFRFCPGCALPVAGEGVLSTEIEAQRQAAERRIRDSEPWRRALLVTGVGLMVVFVAGVGVLLFDRELLGRFLDVAIEPPSGEPERRFWTPEWRPVPAGAYMSGPPGDLVETWVDRPFEISKYEVPNRVWAQFLAARGPLLRELNLWEEAVPREDAGWEAAPDGTPVPLPGRADHPVRDIVPLAAALFCEWLTEELCRDGEEIRLPTSSEWEYAARGPEAKPYPWGEIFADVAPPARTGQHERRPPRNVNGIEPSAVHEVYDDTSVPFGVVAMGTNVSEIVVSTAPQGAERLFDLLDRRAAFTASAGASYANSLKYAEMNARVWDRRDFDVRTRFVSVGLRLVKARRIR